VDALPQLVTEVPGPRSRALAARLAHVESPDVTHLPADRRWPVFWEGGEGMGIRDVDGNLLLDATAAFGVSVLGHASAELAAALGEQAACLAHGMGDVHPTALKVELCERLAALAPFPEPARVLLATTGAEAVEGALKTARLATGASRILAFEGAYHGLTYGTLGVTWRDHFSASFHDQLPADLVVHAPYTRAGVQALSHAQLEGVGAILVEPIQGRGGVVVPEPGFLADLRQLADRQGALLIMDEIFTGCGRTGDWFACQHEEVCPDLLVLGKALSGCFPISAVLGRARLLEAWPPSGGEARHTSTHAGHPMGCRAALLTLDLLEERALVGRARDLGHRLHEALQALAAAHPDLVAGARGRGLMQALVLQGEGRGAHLAREALARGLLVLPAGDRGEVLQLTPPLCLEEHHLEAILRLLDESLTALR
jgi:4-aminobutyrate aminotransferase-like enzyme